MDSRVTILGKKNSCLNQILYEMRDENIQRDRLRFRTNLEKTGELLAYEISRELSYLPRVVTTPLGELEMNLPVTPPVLVSILRAGVPLHNGFLRMFDHADNGFISAFRQHTTENEFVVKVEYTAIPDVTHRDLIVIDPMIATGRSIVLSIREIYGMGHPEKLFIAGVVASEEGLEYVLRNIPNARIYVAAVDNELTAKSYIVPGLGDAGDLAFGPK
ncbi:MAG: uracil phosphoribosyltransferase [Bacteroidia bacterium]|nr:uracil phosphoribosyltransferase [Bacteroidia bacterium]